MSKKKEVISIIFLYFLSVSFFVGANSMQGDSGLVPRILSVIIFFLNTVEAINIFYKNKVINIKREDRENKKLLIILLTCVGYVLLLKPLGFVISTIIFLTATFKLLGVKNNKLILGVSVITALLIFISFGILLKVQVPKGILGF